MTLKRTVLAIACLSILMLNARTIRAEETTHSESEVEASAAAEHHDAKTAEGEKVDFPVMREHLIGRNRFEIPNPFHITHPIELYVPVWIVPQPDQLTLTDGSHHEGIILSEDVENVVMDEILEEEGHRFIEKQTYPRSEVSDLQNVANIDLSLYKQVIMMWAVALVLFFSLRTAGRRSHFVPKGRKQNLIEIFVLFFRDDVIYGNMGKKQGRRFAPLILSLFFFILLANLFGLIPGTTTATGSVSVTAALALVTFTATQVFGNKNYWRHIFATPGIPLWLLPIMIPVEMLGLFTKPFALTIRLFANMTAGHIIILAFLGMIINFHTGWIALGAVPLSAAIFMLEIFVAFLQAYIFALLSAIFIGAAVEEHEHH